MLTREAILSELYDLLEGDQSCKVTGQLIANTIDKLIFFGASPYEPRGVGDAGLSRELWDRILQFRIPYNRYGWYVDWLDSEVSKE